MEYVVVAFERCGGGAWNIASMKEIAQLARVSQVTASLVLNGKADQYRIAAATQKRVLEAARALNYQPNISAKRLRSRGEKVVPIIAVFWTTDARWQLIGRFLKGVQAAVNSRESEHEILIQPFTGSRLCDVKSLMTGTRFNGAIIANPTLEDEQFLAETDVPLPIVLYQRNSAKYCSVNVDNYASGCKVADLLAARGHQAAGIVVPEVSSRAVQLRFDGFMDTCAQRGIVVKDEHIVKGDFSEAGGYRSAMKLAESHSRPSGLFFLSDQMAVGGLRTFYERGISVPEEIEVVGHDNFEIAEYAVPSLTTVHLPVEQMAEASVGLVIDLMSHKATPPISVKFDFHLVVRQSCGDFDSKWGSATSNRKEEN